MVCAVLAAKNLNDFPNSDDVNFLKLSKRSNQSEDIAPDYVMLWKQCDLFMQFDFTELEKNPPRRFLFPYAEFSAYEYADMLADIAEEIDTINATISDAKDLNEVQNKLRDMLQVLKNVNLEPEDRSHLSEKINEGFDKIKERREEEKKDIRRKI
jgi:hypothetical protein